MLLRVVHSFEKLLCFPIIEVMVLYSAKHKKCEAVVEHPEEVCGWNFLSEIKGMFEQMLSILLHIGDHIRAELLGGGKAFIAVFNALRDT